jgi:hypothetical protein
MLDFGWVWICCWVVLLGGLVLLRCRIGLWSGQRCHIPIVKGLFFLVCEMSETVPLGATLRVERDPEAN